MSHVARWVQIAVLTGVAFCLSTVGKLTRVGKIAWHNHNTVNGFIGDDRSKDVRISSYNS